jgi:hypothetical protein
MNLETIFQTNKSESKLHKINLFVNFLMSEKYGKIGENDKLLRELLWTLKLSLQFLKDLDKEEAFAVKKKVLTNFLLRRYKSATKTLPRIQQLCIDIGLEIEDFKDLEVFTTTCENVILATNQVIRNIPSDDKEFTEVIAKSLLDTKGEEGLATVIRVWDDLGVKGCLTVERSEIVKAFTVLRAILSRLSEEDTNIVLTAFVQEFERRASQKRKKRAGGSLEDVTSFILKYYDIPTTHKPDHFQADIEVDKWVKTKDQWLIGISCKRTLRERWKQVSSADAATLSKFKIKYVYHVLTYDEDLSDDKLTLLGGLRHIFYLPDNSRVLAHAQAHVGLKDYVRPMSNFIKDLKAEIK